LASGTAKEIKWYKMEKILEIKEITEHRDRHPMSGFAVVTNKQTIKLLIDDYQYCCENHGYFMSEDDFTEFIGAELIDIALTDTALKETKLKDRGLEQNSTWIDIDLMFVDLKTTKGVLQFVAYNKHNGYYGHDACVVSRQLNHNVKFNWLSIS
jgi:hypothetical protein